MTELEQRYLEAKQTLEDIAKNKRAAISQLEEARILVRELPFKIEEMEYSLISANAVYVAIEAEYDKERNDAAAREIAEKAQAEA